MYKVRIIDFSNPSKSVHKYWNLAQFRCLNKPSLLTPIMCLWGRIIVVGHIILFCWIVCKYANIFIRNQILVLLIMIFSEWHKFSQGTSPLNHKIPVNCDYSGQSSLHQTYLIITVLWTEIHSSQECISFGVIQTGSET